MGKNKTDPWSEKQFKKSKVKGNEELWREAAEAVAQPTDEQKVKKLLIGTNTRKNKDHE